MIPDKSQRRGIYSKIIIPFTIALGFLIYDILFSKGTHDIVIPVGIILLTLIYAYGIFSGINRSKK
jgi:hypothetical protein